MVAPSTSPPPKYIGYVIVVAVMTLFAVSAIVVLEFIRPGQDNVTLDTIIVGFISATTASILGFMKGEETHKSVNSRLDDFITNAQDIAFQEGVDKGKELKDSGKQK